MCWIDSSGKGEFLLLGIPSFYVFTKFIFHAPLLPSTILPQQAL